MQSPAGNRIAVVTGATGAIGSAIAEAIAAEPGFEVVLVARDRSKAERTARSIGAKQPAARLSIEIADLSRREPIEALAKRLPSSLHVLVNNHAVAPRRRLETADGIELVLATNVLGYVWMTELLRPALAAGARESKRRSRVVNVASYWAGDLDAEDLEFRRRRYDNDTAYRQSKQANRMLTVALASRLAKDSIDVNACHPGDVSSTLSHDLGFGGATSPEDGADTPAWLATSPELDGISGRYFDHRAERSCQFSRNAAAIEALYARVAAYAARV